MKADMFYEKLNEADRYFLTRVLIVDYSFIETISKEEMFIHFIGPLLDASYIRGYKTIVLYDGESFEDVKERLKVLCFDAEAFSLKEVLEMTNIKLTAVVCKKRLYKKLLKNNFKGLFFVLS